MISAVVIRAQRSVCAGAMVLLAIGLWAYIHQLFLVGRNMTRRASRQIRSTRSVEILHVVAQRAARRARSFTAAADQRLQFLTTGGMAALALAPTTAFEGLEGRQLLSSVTLSNGVLTVNSDSNTTRISVTYNSSTGKVT